MSEEEVVENTGAEEGQVAAEPTETGAEEAQVAAEQEEQQPDTDWVRARETMKTQSGLIKELKEEVSHLRTAKMQENKEQQPKGYFADRDKEDIITVGELEGVLAKQEQEFQAQQARAVTRAQYPDMDEVINKYGKSLPDSVKAAVMRAPNPHLAAYEAIKNSEGYYKDQMSLSKHENAAKAEKNLGKPGSVSSVGGSGALSKASYYESMSEADLLAASDKYIRGG